ncbi:hypothetical protein H9X77_17320, partial [Clostridium saudiense]|nr:hypothetical protein [Clostridium saudiense]
SSAFFRSFLVLATTKTIQSPTRLTTSLTNVGISLNINIDEVRKMEGVVEVIDYSMLPSASSHGVIFKDIPTLVKDVVKRVGDCIVLVVAKTKKDLKNALD